MLPPALQSAWKGLLEAFRCVPKPTQSNGCGCKFCISDSKILELLAIPPDQIKDDSDVRRYLANARGTVGTDEDFTFLLPGLARIWAEPEVADEWYQENFWQALQRGEFLATQLSPDLRAAFIDFLRAALLVRLGRGSQLTRIKGSALPHSWAEDLGGFSRVCDSLESLWTFWWRVSSEGHARSVLQYGSCWVFESAANPLFAQIPSGGGGPCLHQLGRGLWRDVNLEFLRKTLNVGYLEAAFEWAIQRLEDHSDKQMATDVLEQLRMDRAGAERRIAAYFEV